MKKLSLTYKEAKFLLQNYCGFRYFLPFLGGHINSLRSSNFFKFKLFFEEARQIRYEWFYEQQRFLFLSKRFDSTYFDVLNIKI